MKPLFIPLNAKYYTMFEDGSKTTEYRLYGPRWHEGTVTPGRPVVLSKGYGKQNRLKTVVIRLRKIKNTFSDIYPKGAILAAIDVDPRIRTMQ